MLHEPTNFSKKTARQQTGGFVLLDCDLRMVGGHDLGHQLLHIGGLHPVGGIETLELLLEELIVHLDGLADVDELVGGLLEAR